MDVFLDALIDSLKVLPFLFVVYVLIEVIEKQYLFGTRVDKLLNGRFTPVLGAGVGLIPQCGFSVMASNLYVTKKISAGTLVAVFIATSDEAIPILLTNFNTGWRLLPILGIKFIFALIMGYAIDFFYRKKRSPERAPIQAIAATESVVSDAHAEEKLVSESNDSHTKGCCGHHLEAKTAPKGQDIFREYILHPLIHSLKIFLFIFAVTLVFGYIIEWIGEDTLTAFLTRHVLLQPLLCAVIGLIPNCASSVIIAQLYVLGGIGTGACIAGLSVNAGIAGAVLLRKSKNIKDSLFLLVLIFLASVLLGTVLALFPF